MFLYKLTCFYADGNRILTFANLSQTAWSCSVVDQLHVIPILFPSWYTKVTLKTDWLSGKRSGPCLWSSYFKGNKIASSLLEDAIILVVPQPPNTVFPRGTIEKPLLLAQDYHICTFRLFSLLQYNTRTSRLPAFEKLEPRNSPQFLLANQWIDYSLTNHWISNVSYYMI